MCNHRIPHLGLRVIVLTWLFMQPAILFAGAEAAIADGGQDPLQARFVRDFADFAGSTENAQNLYSGLRFGSRITLTKSVTRRDGGRGTSVLQFNPAGRPMGIGSAFISMTLARHQLANHGIVRPMPQQIEAALNGGTVRLAGPGARAVVLNGVLKQRSEGLNWGVIAKASGMNPGAAIGGLRDRTAGIVAAPSDSRRVHARSARGTLRTSAVPPVREPVRDDGLIKQ